MSERRPSPAVYGVETEYSCLVTLPGKVEHEITGVCNSAASQSMIDKKPDRSGSKRLSEHVRRGLKDTLGIISADATSMLSNGGRLYTDPSGQEYATPETSTAEDAVHRVFEGDKILLEVFGYLKRKEIIEEFQLNRRVVDHNRSSRGIHLNTSASMTSEMPGPDVRLRLAALNVAKGAMFGSGGLLVDERGNKAFHHSPRLSITNQVYSNDHIQRPLIRYPFKQEGGGRLHRIETITSDALSFGWPLRASLVATNATVGLIEIGYGHKLPSISEEKAIVSARSIGRFGAKGYMYINDKDGNPQRTRSLSVLRRIAETILSVHDKEEQLDNESVQVINEIIDVGDQMEKDPFSVGVQVESVARQAAIMRKMERDNLTIDSEPICRYDYAWDWIGGGFAEAMRERGKAGWLGFGQRPSVEDTAIRMVTPPQDTRAKIRGMMIQKKLHNNRSDWGEIDFGGERTRYLHPLQTQLPDGVNIEQHWQL